MCASPLLLHLCPCPCLCLCQYLSCVCVCLCRCLCQWRVGVFVCVCFCCATMCFVCLQGMLRGLLSQFHDVEDFMQMSKQNQPKRKRTLSKSMIEVTHLDYIDVLQAIKLACSRPALKKMIVQDHQPMPPTSLWLLGKMEVEWCTNGLQADDFWNYATQPVPVEEEGRRYRRSNVQDTPWLQAIA